MPVMNRKRWRLVLPAVTMLVLVILAAGCGGGGGKRITGLTPTGVVQTFYNEAQDGHTGTASLYLAPDDGGSTAAVVKSLTSKLSLKDLKNTNLLAVKEAARQDNFAVVVATLQVQNSANVVVQPVGLEKIDGEWYIVNPEKVAQDAQYQVLAQLLTKL